MSAVASLVCMASHAPFQVARRLEPPLPICGTDSSSMQTWHAAVTAHLAGGKMMKQMLTTANSFRVFLSDFESKFKSFGKPVFVTCGTRVNLDVTVMLPDDGFRFVELLHIGAHHWNSTSQYFPRKRPKLGEDHVSCCSCCCVGGDGHVRIHFRRPTTHRTAPTHAHTQNE